MLTSASSEKRETRPRSRSLIRGCVTPQRLAASACVQSVFLQACRDLLHQFGPRSQIRSLLGGVRDRIPNTGVALGLLISFLPTVA